MERKRVEVAWHLWRSDAPMLKTYDCTDREPITPTQREIQLRAALESLRRAQRRGASDDLLESLRFRVETLERHPADAVGRRLTHE
jgi:hypothetical protein